jgi:hypothetical protein
MKRFVLLVLLCACGHSDTSGTHDSGGSGAMSDGANDGNTSSPTTNGTISCYTQGAPSATCMQPQHCCFSNFSAQHDGACSGADCAWGTIECDGPEDCTNSGHCCSTQLSDQDGTFGYRVVCQSAACGSQPVHEELCHPGGPACSNGGSCVTASGTNNDLPRSLYVCR